jgi:hypothetical protein
VLLLKEQWGLLGGFTIGDVVMSANDFNMYKRNEKKKALVMMKRGTII